MQNGSYRNTIVVLLKDTIDVYELWMDEADRRSDIMKQDTSIFTAEARQHLESLTEALGQVKFFGQRIIELKGILDSMR